MTTTIEYNTLADLIKACSRLYQVEITYSEYLERRAYIMEQEEEVKAVLNKCKKDELMKYYRGYRDAKKDQLVNSLYDTLCSSFLVGDTLQIDYMSKETHKQACARDFAKITPEVFAAWQVEGQEKAAAKKKALTNPETMEEFRTFVMYRSEGALSPAQREVYDELRTGKTREQRAREAEALAQIKSVDTGGIEMTGPIATKHTKHGYDLWVIQLVGRVERPIYQELEEKAKKLGGWYSSFRGSGAVPGFQFKEERSAVSFMNLQKGDVDATEIFADRAEAKAERRADNLDAKGERLEGSAKEDLTADRKTNTVKRAREAGYAEARAMHEIEFGKTMQVIADGQRDGSIKYLDRIANYTDMETLYSLISNARYRYTQAKKINSSDYDEDFPDLVEFIRYPYPVIQLERMARILQKLAGEPGKRLAANRLMKLCARAEKAKKEAVRLTYAHELEDYATVLCRSSRVVDSYELDNYREMLQTLNRVQRMGFKEDFELRTAIRELLKVKKLAAIDPETKRAQEIREVERKFVGKEIPGFFPTPLELADEVIDKADIQDGHRVGEFSAGLGHIADVILKRLLAMDSSSEINLDLIEIRPDLCQALRQKGHVQVTCADFLQVEPNPIYDRVVINPPFENDQDVEHVQHAFKFLKPGGRLVAIMAGNKDQGRFSAFRSWVEQYGGVIEANEPGAFKSAFRATGVNTCTLVIDK